MQLGWVRMNAESIYIRSLDKFRTHKTLNRDNCGIGKDAVLETCRR